MAANLSPATGQDRQREGANTSRKNGGGAGTVCPGRALGEVALFGMFIFLFPGSVESYGRPEQARTC